MKVDEGTQTAVVTGAASGIGRATTLLLVSEGWSVVAADMNRSALDALVAETGHDRVEPIVTDVSVEDDVQAAVAAAVTRFGRCSAMVNNAGVGGAFGSLTEIEAADWDYTFNVIARGVFFGIKHAARTMIPAGGGCIVNLSSAAAFNGGGGPAVYSAAKAAVVNLTQSAALEFAEHRIRVNAVAPGVVMTPLLNADERQEPPVGQPWRSWGRPEDIAAAIAFLVADGSRFITGQTIVADGGLVAAGPGPDFARSMGTDVRRTGVVGVNRGSTGQRSEVRRRVPPTGVAIVTEHG